MSHDLTIRADGTVEMFSAGPQPVWHRLGQRTESAVTSEAAIRMAGLDWLVAEKPIEVLDPDRGNKEVTTHKAIVRTDSHAVLGIVGSRYTPVQNREAFAWLDDVVGDRLAIYETAGSLHGGKVVWMMIRLPAELRVKNTDDVSHPYVLVCNAHDGTRALRVLNCSVRVVCNNTLTLALGRGEGTGLSIRHTASINERMDEARHTLGIATRGFQRLQSEMDRLADRTVTDEEVRTYFETVWPDNPDVEDNTRAKAARERMLLNFHAGPQRMPGVRGTAWAAYNAVSQYTDWQRPTRGRTPHRKDHNRLASIWFGDSAALKRQAWGEALKLCSSN